MVGVERMEEAESTERVSLLLVRNMLEIAIYNISYIRGLFPEKYFNDNLVPQSDMRVKKLMPVDTESGCLIDLVEKGVYDALQKKYLKTLLFCICEKGDGLTIEEYAFSFSYPNTSNEEVAISMSCTGNKKNSTIIMTNTAEIASGYIRRSSCKMIRAIISIMSGVNPMPAERSILMKFLYFDETPDDYTPPFIKRWAHNKAIDVWTKNPLKMGNAIRKNYVMIISIPCDVTCSNSGDAEISKANENDSNDLPDIKAGMQAPQKSGYVFVAASKEIEFMLDSGATHHICNDVTIMKHLIDVQEQDQVTLYSANGQQFKATKMGTVVYKNFKLSQVGFIPEMAFNVISVGQLASQGLLTSIADSRFAVIEPKTVKLVGEGFLQKRKVKKDKGKKLPREYYEYIFRTINWIVPNVSNALVNIAEGFDDSNSNEYPTEKWFIDTGCERHMVPELSHLSYQRIKVLPFQGAGGTIWSTHEGSVKVGEFELKNVLCAPNTTSNLISGIMLDLTGHRIIFYGTTCKIVHKDGLKEKGIATMDPVTRMYSVKR